MGKFLLKHKILATLTLGLISLGALQSVAIAAAPVPASTIPSAGDFEQGSQVSLVTAIRGGGYVLDSPNSTVRLYSPKNGKPPGTQITVNIINGGNCPGQGGDVGPNNNEATTTFRVWALQPDNSATGADYINTPFLARTFLVASVTNKTILCNSNWPLSFQTDEPAVNYGPASGKWAFEIEAVMSGPAGWNQFKYQVSPGGGRLSYYAGSGDHFAVKAVDGSSPNNGNYHFGFAPGCATRDGATTSRTLKWFDEDAGESNQPSGLPYVRTEIIEYNNDGSESHNPVQIARRADGSLDITRASNGGVTADGHRIIDITSGDDVGGDVNIQWRGHKKYRWIHYDIYTGNGIQFELPFDSYNTLIDFNKDCPQPLSASCTIVSVSNANPNPGQTITIQIRMNNTGTATWTAGQQLMKRTGPSIRNFALTGNIARGGGVTFTDTITAPTTNYYTYRMYVNDSTQMNQTPIPCRTYITLGSPTCPPGGCPGIPPEIVVNSCSSATVRNVNDSSIRATYLSGGVNRPITQVPAQIVVKDSGGTTIYTYTVPSGAGPGQGGITKNQDYNVPMATIWANANMFPHRDYSLTLVLQGTNVQNSISYTNNGSWANAAGTPFYNPPVTFNTADITGCWDADCSGDFSTASSLEPGQSTSVNVGFRVTNRSPRSFNDASHYNMVPSASPGAYLETGRVALNIPAGIVDTVVNGSLTIRLDYTGQFSGEMFFGNSISMAGPCSSPDNTPATRPYFQVYGGDINTGGGFETVNASGAFSCPSTYPDYVSPSTTGNINRAGIKAYGASDGTYGSLSDFGALSLGVIAKDDSLHINFGAQPSFSNSAAPYLGQLNSSPPSFCTFNFYDRGVQARNPTPKSAGDLDVRSAGYYVTNGSVDNLSGGLISRQQRTIIFIRGDVTITGNIIYDEWDTATTSSAPSFALIVKGNINLAPNVTRLDGMYVAQPSSSGNDGEFSTCANNSGNQFCNQQLRVNGAVIARVIKPLRSVGTLSPDANPAFVPAPGHNAAEIFNYIPSMVIAPPDFTGEQSGLEGLFSLPPVF